MFLECGLGKTKITLDVIAYRKTIRKPYTALIVCPNTLIDNWVDEIEKHSDLSYVTLSGTPKRRLKKLEESADVYLINYEGTRIITPELQKKGFQLLVCDESTALKNPSTQQSKACYLISQMIKHKLILTGTPVLNNPLDIFGQYRVLNPLIFGHNFYKFKHKFAVMGGYMNKQVAKWINMDLFKSRLGVCAIRLTKDDCLDLPDKLYQDIRLELSNEQQSVYNGLYKDFIATHKDSVVTAPIMLTRLLRFSQITAGFTKDVEGVEHAFETNPKVDWLMDFLAGLDPKRKIVVFVRFLKEIEMLKNKLSSANIKYEVVYGEVKDRIDCVKRFNEDAGTRVFVGQLQTTGMGINLTAASYVVFLTNSYSYGERIQCEDRCHRIGQTRNVTYIDLICKNTIDVAICRALKKKESLSNMVVEDLVNIVKGGE